MKKENTNKNLIDKSQINARGDIRIGDDINIIERRGLEEVKLVDIENYPFPAFAEQLLVFLKSMQFIFIGGDQHQFDINGFLNPLVALFRKKWPEFKDWTVVQFFELSSLDQVEKEMRKASTPSIFLLANLEPGLAQYDLSRLSALPKLLDEHHHFLLISTSFSSEEWRLEENQTEGLFWVSEDNVNYPEKELKLYLDQLLANISCSIEFSLEMKEQIIKNLHTPARLEYFAKNLKYFKTPINDQTLLSFLHEIKDSSSSLELWYRQLQEHQSLIALAMSMFSGMYADQFFAALDQLIEGPWKYWRNRYRDLEILDYSDLSFMSNYFHYGGGWILCVYPEHRRIIFKRAWRMHRRSILAALPCLVEMVERSCEKLGDRELYGKSRKSNKCKALRQSLGKTLSEVALINLPSVEPYLIRLASNPNIGVQLVGAYVLAQLSIKGKSLRPNDTNPLVSLWKEWLDNEGAVEAILSGIQNEGELPDSSSKARSYISATLALTLGYITETIPSGELNDEHLDIFRKLPAQKNKMVVDRISYILSVMILRHLKQLSELIRDNLLQHSEYIEPVAKLLSAAYKKYKQNYPFNTNEQSSIRSLLIIWSEYVTTLPRQPLGRKKLSHRGILLCAIARTYGSIQYDLSDHPFKITMQEAYESLSDLRQKEVNEDIRKHLLNGMLHLIRFDYKREEFVGIDHIPYISSEEKVSIENELVRLYFEDRLALEPAEEAAIKIQMELPLISKKEPGFQFFYSWKDPDKRPKTKAEKYLLRWLRGSNRILSQIAASCLLRISDFEEKEKLMHQKEEDIQEHFEGDEGANSKNELKRTPIRDGSLPESEEVKAFLALIKPYLSDKSFHAIQQVSPVLLHKKNVDPQLAESIYKPLCSEEESDMLFVLYRIFNNVITFPHELLAKPRFSEKFLAWMLPILFKVGDAGNWRRLTPLLLREKNRRQNDLELILKWVTHSRQNSTNLALCIRVFRVFFKTRSPFEKNHYTKP